MEVTANLVFICNIEYTRVLEKCLFAKKNSKLQPQIIPPKLQAELL